VTVTPFSAASAMPSDKAITTLEAPVSIQSFSAAEPTPRLQRRKSRVPETKGQPVHSRIASSAPRFPRNISAVSSPSQPQAEHKSTRRLAVWHVIPKAGGWTIRSVKLGFSKVGSHLGFGRRHQDGSGQ
jgi:hypothetical protein